MVAVTWRTWLQLVTAGIPTYGLPVWLRFPHTMAVWDQYHDPQKTKASHALISLAQTPSEPQWTNTSLEAKRETEHVI